MHERAVLTFGSDIDADFEFLTVSLFIKDLVNYSVSKHRFL